MACLMFLACVYFSPQKLTNNAVLTTSSLCLSQGAILTASRPSVPQCSFDHCDLPELISPSNVAVYGGLCALATYSRAQLKSDVIGSA